MMASGTSDADSALVEGEVELLQPADDAAEPALAADALPGTVTSPTSAAPAPQAAESTPLQPDAPGEAEAEVLASPTPDALDEASGSSETEAPGLEVRAPRAPLPLPAPEAEAGFQLTEPWEISAQGEPAATDTDAGSTGATPPEAAAEESMQLAATWEFVGWEGNPQAPQPPAPWTAIGAEEPLELARQPADTSTQAPSLSLEEALGTLDGTSRYDVIGTTLFDFCRDRFQRVLLMTVRYGTAMVVRGIGPSSGGLAVAALRLSLEQPSVFKSAAAQRLPMVMGPPSSEQEIEFFAAFADPPVEAIVLPVMRGEELVDLLYADCGSTPLPPSTMDEFTQLTLAAAEAHARSGEQQG